MTWTIEVHKCGRSRLVNRLNTQMFKTLLSIEVWDSNLQTLDLRWRALLVESCAHGRQI